MRVLIDADAIVYACGFAAETMLHILHWVDVTDPEDSWSDVEHECEFRYKWRLDAFMELQALSSEEVEISKRVQP